MYIFQTVYIIGIQIQFCERISSIIVSKQSHISCHIYNKTFRWKYIIDRLLSSKRRNSECFPVSIGVYASFLNRRASRNCSEGLVDTLLAELQTHQILLISPLFFLHDHLTSSKHFHMMEDSYSSKTCNS